MLRTPRAVARAVYPGEMRALSRPPVPLLARSFAQVAQKPVPARRATKKEGTVAEFFENLTSEGPPLPARFADLKKEMCVDRGAIEHAWRAVLKELEGATEEIVQRGNEVGLRLTFRGEYEMEANTGVVDDYARSL